MPPRTGSTDWTAGQVLHGFSLQRSVSLTMLQARCYELRHAATGARALHIGCNDRENAFGVTFKTVPTDATGVAHILEHTVLCGSRRFPVRDPFFSMLRRSLSTFMNAFTASDWTMYPFATQNRQDFYNLLSVYLDSVFYPRLDRLSFRQEGHRLEFAHAAHESGSNRLTYKGVVFNEMKGAMSSPEQVMARTILGALYPDTTYRFNSGGDPAQIPHLSHEALVAFHQRHYHPSNAFFFTYGDLPLDAHLQFIDHHYLRHFERIDPDSEVPSQPRWDQPRRVSCPYPLGVGENPEKKFQAGLAWLTADIRDSYEVLILRILDQVLLGNAASPLRKTLIDTGLGSALSDSSGFDADNKDTHFACGLKEVTAAAVGPIATTIFEVLEQQATRGIDRELVNSAIHQIEFARREKSNHPYPYGLKLLLAITGPWLHGGDPLDVLQFEPDMNRLNRETRKTGLLEERIRTYFLDNPHRILFTLEPDPTLAQREEEHLTAGLEATAASLSPTQATAIRQESEALRRLQEKQEDVSLLPTLALEEIPLEVDRMLPSSTAADSEAILLYAQPTGGIFYFSAALGCGHLASGLLPLVPFFCHALPRTGTVRSDYVDLARRIDAVTGGLSLAPQARTRFDAAGTCLPMVAFGGKCLERNRGPMLALIAELLQQFRFSDHGRLKNLLLEYRAGLESMVVPGGHRLAMLRAARSFSAASALAETWDGIAQIQTIKQLTGDLTAAKLCSLEHDLLAIARSLFYRENLRTALVGAAEHLDAATRSIVDLRAQLATGCGSIFDPPSLPLDLEPAHEGWSTATTVSFVAASFPTARLQAPDGPALAVIAKLLRSLLLHREIREKGGAYGGFATYNPEEGLFSFGSYRDPHILTTLQVFQQAGDFLQAGGFDQEEVKEAILQVCSDIDKPHPPGPAARKAFYRRLVGLSDEDRLRFKRQVLALDRRAVLETAARCFTLPVTQWGVAVIADEEKLRSVNQRLAENPLKLERI